MRFDVVGTLIDFDQGILDWRTPSGTALRCASRPRWPAFPDAPEVLADLGRRYRLVASTNADNWALARVAATLGDPFDDA